MNASVTKKNNDREKSSVRYIIYQVTICIVHFMLCRVTPYYHKCQTIQFSFFFRFLIPIRSLFYYDLGIYHTIFMVASFVFFLYISLTLFHATICLCTCVLCAPWHPFQCNDIALCAATTATTTCDQSGWMYTVYLLKLRTHLGWNVVASKFHIASQTGCRTW